MHANTAQLERLCMQAAAHEMHQGLTPSLSCRGLIYQPTVCGAIASLKISIDEPLVWRLYEFARGLQSTSTASTTASPGGPEGSSQQSQVAVAELPLQIDLLTFDDVQITLSTRTDTTVRPRWANQVMLHLRAHGCCWHGHD